MKITKKTYVYLQSGRTTTWIKVKKNARSMESLFVSGIRNDVVGDFYVTHLVFETDSWNNKEDSYRIPNEKVRNFIKENNLRLAGVRMGWTGWQGKLDDENGIVKIAAMLKAFSLTGWNLLEIAKDAPEYRKFMEG